VPISPTGMVAITLFARSSGASSLQQYVAKLAETAINYPPMQDPAFFNPDAVKKKVEEIIKSREGQ
jgi:hypothetical protein